MNGIDYLAWTFVALMLTSFVAFIYQRGIRQMLTSACVEGFANLESWITSEMHSSLHHDEYVEILLASITHAKENCTNITVQALSKALEDKKVAEFNTKVEHALKHHEHENVRVINRKYELLFYGTMLVNTWWMGVFVGTLLLAVAISDAVARLVDRLKGRSGRGAHQRSFEAVLERRLPKRPYLPMNLTT